MLPTEKTNSFRKIALAQRSLSLGREYRQSRNVWEPQSHLSPPDFGKADHFIERPRHITNRNAERQDSSVAVYCGIPVPLSKNWSDESKFRHPIIAFVTWSAIRLHRVSRSNNSAQWFGRAGKSISQGGMIPIIICATQEATEWASLRFLHTGIKTPQWYCGKI